jgi:hypothetical protein
MVVGALTIALSQLRASGRWRGARAWLSVALFVALFVALLGSAIQGAVMLAGAPGVKALNDALGLVPSVLGDTGTGVEDLVRWPGLGAGY